MKTVFLFLISFSIIYTSFAQSTVYGLGDDGFYFLNSFNKCCLIRSKVPISSFNTPLGESTINTRFNSIYYTVKKRSVLSAPDTIISIDMVKDTVIRDTVSDCYCTNIEYNDYDNRLYGINGMRIGYYDFSTHQSVLLRDSVIYGDVIKSNSAMTLETYYFTTRGGSSAYDTLIIYNVFYDKLSKNIVCKTCMDDIESPSVHLYSLSGNGVIEYAMSTMYHVYGFDTTNIVHGSIAKSVSGNPDIVLSIKRSNSADNDTLVIFSSGRDGIFLSKFGILNSAVHFVAPQIGFASAITGVENEIIKGFKVCPNPAKDIVNIDLSDINLEIISIQIIDINHKVLYDTQVSNGHLSISLANYLPGNYFIILNTKIGTITEIVNKQ